MNETRTTDTALSHRRASHARPAENSQRRNRSASKWTRAVFQIAMRSGPQTRPGFTYRELGLHYEGPHWTVTHLNTGHSLCDISADERRAKIIGAMLAECGDWSFKAINPVPPEIVAAARAIIAATPECKRDDEPAPKAARKRSKRIAEKIAKARRDSGARA